MKSSSFLRFIIVFSVSLIGICLFAYSCSKHTEQKQNTAECFKLADEHWSKEEYKQWLIDSVYYVNPNVNYENVCDTFPYWNREEQFWEYFPHHLPDQKTQQYYEMIGKYEQFRWGWDDYSDSSRSSLHREAYMECLQKAGKVSKLSPTMP